MSVAPFDFSHFFTHAEILEFLRQMAVAYPDLITWEVIGRSYEGRDIVLATLTQRRTGPALEKPAYWIDANTHAGEVTGSAVALYDIHYLLTHYGQEERVTRLLDGYTVYVLPRVAVDGAEKYLTTPYRLRSGPRPYPEPEPQPGLYPEDVNGDGKILQMRKEDPCGAWKVSSLDPRILVRRDPEEFGGTYYHLMTEGLIREFDGYDVPVAPPLEGLDFNRNYPHEWVPENEQVGAGDFPYSEPETRAIGEFLRSHRNINGFVTYHTSSAVHIRPYATHPDEYYPPEDLDIYKLIGERATEITGYPTISGYHQFRYHPKKVSHGNFNSYAYDTFGWYGFTTELWDLPTEAGVVKKDFIQWFRWHPEADDLKRLKWNDRVLGGRGFIDWQPFEHPQLGRVEIGGWDYKAVWQNAPPEMLPELCEKHCRFAIAHALMSPRLALARSEVRRLGWAREGSQSLFRVVVQYENQGFLPTYTSQKALERRAVRPIQVRLELPEGSTVIVGSQKQEIRHLEGRSNKAYGEILSSGSGVDYRRKVEWVVQAPVGSSLLIVAQAERAGTVRTRVTLSDEGVGAGTP
jgi:murein tripeptide amidase MpaA